VANAILLWQSSELLAERCNVKAGKNWDKRIAGITILLGPMATWIMAGLDTRSHWSRDMPPLALLDGLLVAVPATVTAATTVLRTTLEDRTLHAELDGYADYALRVKYRLLPLIW